LSVYFSKKSVEEVLSRSKSIILSALVKYGYFNFKLEILEYCESSQTIIREQYYLNLLCPEYNILSIASSSLGRPVSEETRLKISNSLKGRSIPELVRQKMSLSRIGKVFSDETKKILSEQRKGKDSPFLGKQHSIETKNKMSEAHGTKVEVLNKDTLETIIYPSYAKAAEAIGCAESTIRY
jgi:group I intron endonuclease